RPSDETSGRRRCSHAATGSYCYDGLAVAVRHRFRSILGAAVRHGVWLRLVWRADHAGPAARAGIDSVHGRALLFDAVAAFSGRNSGNFEPVLLDLPAY